MFISAVQDENENKTYFAGAFPSGCGKTSTAMIPGLKIVGDDLAYLKNFNGNMRAVNVEKGIFGIIKDINPNNNPIIYNALTSPNEVIFSNILINNGAPYWLGMDKEKPEKGINFSGKWFKDKTDNEGDKIPFAHENARFTLKIKDVKNCDKNYDSKDGVHIKGIIFGGRDSDTSVPVAETFSWNHGVFNGAILESETTAATLGETAKRKHNPMAIYDFLSVPIDEYIKNYINFGNKLENPPKIFTVNYFLKDNQTKNFLNDISDKKIWLLWMEGRVNNKYTAIKTPVGYIPNYKDLKGLFNKHLNKFYKKEDYLNQFSIRINKTLDKLNRIEKEYLNMYDLPLEKTFLELTRLPIEFLEQLKQQRKLLKTAKKKYNKGIITPDKFAK
jgi:phosphoenolpyruvate carboxykinase (GTP)